MWKINQKEAGIGPFKNTNQPIHPPTHRAVVIFTFLGTFDRYVWTLGR